MLNNELLPGIWRALSGNQLLAAVGRMLDFQKRIWIVSIRHQHHSDTFIINEDSFVEPMQWMRRKGYSEAMLHQVEQLQRSQAVELRLGDQCHRLLRVK